MLHSFQRALQVISHIAIVCGSIALLSVTIPAISGLRTLARTFLKQRQGDVSILQEPLALARITCDELRRWVSDIEAGERENTGGYGRWKMTCRDPPNLGLCCG